MQLLDPTHPFFRPLWKRVAVVAVCLGWGTVEFASGAHYWGALFVGAGLYCAWVLLIDFKPGSGPANGPVAGPDGEG